MKHDTRIVWSVIGIGPLVGTIVGAVNSQLIGGFVGAAVGVFLVLPGLQVSIERLRRTRNLGLETAQQ